MATPHPTVIPFPRPHRAARRTPAIAPLPAIQFRGSIRDVAPLLPTFARRQFGTGLEPLGSPTLANSRLQAIVNEHDGIPVGVVSPDYALVQHADALFAVADGLAEFGVPTGAVQVVCDLTAHGEQLAARFTLPGLATVTPRDGHELLPTVMLSNSVDGKSALRAHLGWFRLICQNGLVVPYAVGGLRRRHAHGLSFLDIAFTVARELTRADTQRQQLERFDAAPLDPVAFAAWVDGPLRAEWGASAATRVFHIVSRGMDVVLADPFQAATPSARAVEDFAEVPGRRTRAATAHDALQALTWVASRAENLTQRWERQSQALALAEGLLPA